MPIHIAHIAAGMVLRGRDKKLFTERSLVAARLLLLGPFEGLRGVGEDLTKTLTESAAWDTDSRTFGCPDTLNEWFLCDTTFRGTSEDRQTQTEDALIGDRLFNEGLIRSRAQGRVATLRQRLEFAVLARFRAKYPESWVLVDGPLFFIDKWRRRAHTVLGPILGDTNEGTFEDRLLYNAVGLIKSQRLRPDHPDQVIIIGPEERSPVAPLREEVDMKGYRDSPDEEGGYGGSHFCWYTRFRCRPEPPYGLAGLVRLDIHRATLPGVKRADFLDAKSFQEFTPLVDAITRATWIERWPGLTRLDDYRSATVPYPIQQVERTLKAASLPRRFLAHLVVDALAQGKAASAGTATG